MGMVAAGWGSTGAAKSPRPTAASAAAKSRASSTSADAEMEPKIRAKLAESLDRRLATPREALRPEESTSGRHTSPAQRTASAGDLDPENTLDRGDWAGRFPHDVVGIRTQAAHYAGMPAPDHH